MNNLGKAYDARETHNSKLLLAHLCEVYKGIRRSNLPRFAWREIRQGSKKGESSSKEFL